MRLLLFTTLLLAISLAACGPGEPTATPTPTPTPSPMPSPTPTATLTIAEMPPLTLPADESPHNYQTEWWYFNAHLADETGERYALHDVVFQVQELSSRRTLYVRQVGLAQVSTEVHASSENVRLATRPETAEPGDFNIVIGESVMSGNGGETYHLTGQAGDWSYDLTLTSTSPAMVHDEDGLVDFGDAGITYYYSRPRLELSGTMTSVEGKREVTGLAWLDKQWGNFQPVVVYWDWASIQFEDGTDLMVTNLRDQQQRPIDRYVTLRRPGEDEVRIGGDRFTFEPLDDTWHSEATGTTYPTRWRLAVAEEDIDVTLEPLVEESEFASGLLGVVYWEAGVNVVAGDDGERVGQGFIELNWARAPSPILDNN